MKNKLKHFIAKMLFGKPMVMSVYKDKHGNAFGATIHKDDGKSYVDIISHIKNPNYLGQVKIYL